MAIMIPNNIGYYDPRSGEKDMYDSLKLLPDDYYVMHSFHLNNLIPDKGLNENEIDFIVFNPNYGFLFIEAKNSRVEKDNDGQWWYTHADGTKDKMKDPFNQAYSGAHNLMNALKAKYPDERNLINKCKFLVAVWLPKYNKLELDKIDFGLNAPKEFILTSEALHNSTYIKSRIESIMNRIDKVHIAASIEIIENASGYSQRLNPEDAKSVFNKMVCPTLNCVIDVSKDQDAAYIKLLEEQCVILDFLRYQRTAAISGAAGTGKTLVAVERARRLSVLGNKVLFICFNRNLCDELENTYHHNVVNKDDYKNIDFYTLNKLACEKCKTTYDKVNYVDLCDYLIDEIDNKKFEYKHIVIDEGQDFGNESIEASDILELFNDYCTKNNDNSFFIFYDKNQLVNSRRLPKYIENVDSKLTLYKNCRNTKEIADTAFTLINDTSKNTLNILSDEKPTFVFYKDEGEMIKKLNIILNDVIKKNKFSTRKIVTVSNSLQRSILNNYLNSNDEYIYENNATKVYTSSTIKGLEADNVIVLDLNSNNFIYETDDNGEGIYENNKLVYKDKKFYVAATRAKKKLFIFVSMNDDELTKILNSSFANAPRSSSVKKSFALAMYGSGKIM